MSRRHPQRSSARVQASSECARRGQCASPASQFQTEMERDRHSTVSLAESSAAWGLLTSVALQPSDGLALGAAGLSSKNLLRARAGSICVNGPRRGVEDLRRFGWGARGTCKWATDAKQQISSHTSCPLRQNKYRGSHKFTSPTEVRRQSRPDHVDAQRRGRSDQRSEFRTARRSHLIRDDAGFTKVRAAALTFHSRPASLTLLWCSTGNHRTGGLPRRRSSQSPPPLRGSGRGARRRESRVRLPPRSGGGIP